MYWRRVSTAGVIAGIIVAEIYYVYLKLNGLDGSLYALKLDSLVASWLLGMIVAIAISLVTKPVNAAVVERHFKEQSMTS